MDNNKLILLGAFIVLLVGGVIYVNVNFSSDQSSKSSEQVQEASANTGKSDTEVIIEGTLEGAKFAKETIEEARDNKLKRDSIRKANRISKWVYQIGLPVTNNLKLLEAYNDLSKLSNIKIFKSSRKSYFIYKDDGYSEQQLRDSLESFKSKLSDSDLRVEVIDLMSLCSEREEVVKGDDIKIKKEDVALICYTCD